MTSSINYLGIDQNFPIPGVDNDSQGFRDNFAVIKNNFESAKTDIEELQLNTAKKNESNNFQYNDLSELNLNNYTEQFFGGGIVAINSGTATTTVEWVNGSYQKFVLSRNPELTSTPTALFTLGEWPEADQYAKMVLEFTSSVTGESSNIVNVSFSSPNGGSVRLDNALPSPFAVSGTNTHVVECWSYDRGVTVFVKYLGSFAGV
jgi:hypothetical protein